MKRTLCIFILALAGLWGMGATAVAQQSQPAQQSRDTQQSQNTEDIQEEPAQFDLVVFGENVDSSYLVLWLKPNPGGEVEWERPRPADSARVAGDRHSILVYSGLPSDTYVGQDIRENHLSVKLSTTSAEEEVQVRAVYVFPKSGYTVDKLAKRLLEVIREYPNRLRRFSLAFDLRPLPFRVHSEKAYVEHVELPVRHLKPGLQEVRWLDILFSGE